ncbi:MAG: hypothetical protein KKG64_05260, partial [Firmicutes bacterium]|nr:hypothetical protein [Bacillota bacterium]
HPFYSITYNGSLFKRGLDTIIEKNEIVALYIGFPECPSCNAHIGAFQKYFINEGFDQYVSQIYYINANTDQDGMQDLLDLYIDIATTTPQLVIFKDGVIIATFEPASADDPILINRSVRDFYRDAILAINEE